MKQITRINHIGLRVTDLQTSREFYEKLGFEFLAGPVGPEPVAIMEHPSGVNINFILNSTDKTTHNLLMDIPEKHTGYTHIALEITDPDAVEAELHELGIEITERVEFEGARFFFVRDPDAKRRRDRWSGECIHPIHSKRLIAGSCQQRRVDTADHSDAGCRAERSAFPWDAVAAGGRSRWSGRSGRTAEPAAAAISPVLHRGISVGHRTNRLAARSKKCARSPPRSDPYIAPDVCIGAPGDRRSRVGPASPGRGRFTQRTEASRSFVATARVRNH